MKRSLMLVAVALTAPASLGLDCRELHEGARERVTVVESSMTIAGSELTAVPSRNGGVTIDGLSSSGGFEVLVCRIRWDREPGYAIEARSPDLVVEAIGTELKVTREAKGWSASYIIRVPAGAEVAIETHNGPVTIRDVSGQFEVGSQNGPLRLDGVTGSVTARLQNGPLAFRNLSGEFELSTQNGPISVDLTEGNWYGARVRATTRNGPIKLKTPAVAPIGVSLDAAGWGLIRCPESLCGVIEKDRITGRQTPRSFQFGPATDDLVLRTGNGPVTIQID